MQHPDFHIVLRDKLVKLDKRRTLSGDLRLAMQLGLRGSLQLKNFLTYSREHADELNYSGGSLNRLKRNGITNRSRHSLPLRWWQSRCACSRLLWEPRNRKKFIHRC